MSYDELMNAYLASQEECKKLQIKYDNLELELNSLKRIVFGQKREQTPKQDVINGNVQCSLFMEQEDIEQIDEKMKEEVKEKLEEITIHRKKKTKKAGIKRSFLKNVPIVLKEYKLDSDVKCPECGHDLMPIGKKIVYQEIKYIPAKLEIDQYVEYSYKCSECGNDNSDKETPTILKTTSPKPILTGSIISPSLASQVIYQKYNLGVPLYRQEKMWDDIGLVLPRNMMANWCIKLSEYYFEKIYNLMLKKLKETNNLLHADETTIQCNKEPGRKASSKSYMWVLASGEDEKTQGVVFKYNASRSAKTAQELIQGFKGILVTDGFDAYNNIEGITKHAECWAHARRYFYESIPLTEEKKPDTTATGYKGLSYCDKLFEIEREIKDQIAEEKITKEDIVKVRQEKSKPVLDAFFAWVNTTLEEKIIVNEKLRKALIYAKNQKEELSKFLEDGRIPLSNSLAERAIRPFAVHRKNWLFADSVSGAQANAIIYTLIESAKRNNLNIYEYINYLLEELPQIDNLNNEEELIKYLPWSKELPNNILNFQGSQEELTESKVENANE